MASCAAPFSVAVALGKNLMPAGSFECTTEILFQPRVPSGPTTAAPPGVLKSARSEAGGSTSIWIRVVRPGLTVAAAVAGRSLAQATMPEIVAV